MRIWKLLGIAIVCVALMALVGCGKSEKQEEPSTQVEPAVEEMVAVDYTPTPEEVGTEVNCGVCGMAMAVTADMPAVTYDGTNYFFCTPEEKAAFVADPDKYVKPAEEPAEEPAETTEGESSGH